MARDHIEYASLGEGPQLSLTMDGVPTGGAYWLLSRDHATGAETRFIRLPERWHWHDPGSFGCEMEVYLLRGVLRVGDTILRAGDYAVYQPHARIASIDSESGCEMLWMSSGAIQFGLGGEPTPIWLVEPLHVPDLPWHKSPAYEGRPADEAGAGLSVKFLRGDPALGAYTLLTRHDAGWFDPRLESHDTWEELVLIEGEFLMGNSGVVSAGAYIFRPGERPHGPQATRTKAIWFCRGARHINFRFESPAWVAERSRRYLESAVTGPEKSQSWKGIT